MHEANSVGTPIANANCAATGNAMIAPTGATPRRKYGHGSAAGVTSAISACTNQTTSDAVKTHANAPLASRGARPSRQASTIQARTAKTVAIIGHHVALTVGSCSVKIAACVPMTAVPTATITWIARSMRRPV